MLQTQPNRLSKLLILTKLCAQNCWPMCNRSIVLHSVSYVTTLGRFSWSQSGCWYRISNSPRGFFWSSPSIDGGSNGVRTGVIEKTIILQCRNSVKLAVLDQPFECGTVYGPAGRLQPDSGNAYQPKNVRSNEGANCANRLSLANHLMIGNLHNSSHTAALGVGSTISCPSCSQSR